MNRREIENVKSHLGNICKPFNAVAERTMFVWTNRARTGKHLVPRAVARLLAIYRDTELFVIRRRSARISISAHQGRQFGAPCNRCYRLAAYARKALQLRRGLGQFLQVASARSVRGGLDQPCSHSRSHRNILARFEFFDGIATPTLKWIYPRLDSVGIRSQVLHIKLSLPTVIHERTHN